MAKSPIKLIKTYASFVKFAHTIFALPFALVGMLAAYAVPIEITTAVGGGWEGVRVHHYRSFEWIVLVLVLLCMVGARSFAMAVNRIVDRRIDAQNPRTAVREIPAGKLSPAQAWAFAVLMAAVYFGSCGLLGPTVLMLSPVPIALMVLYPFTKRFTAACHLVLGASLGLAPVGAWVAVRSFDPPALIAFDASSIGWAAVAEPAPWILGGAVLLWVAGFDVIYALQDDEFDREQGLHSIPARFGRAKALWISRGMHILSSGLFVLFISFVEFGTRQSTLPDEIEFPRFAYAAATIVVLGMVIQQALVSPTNLKRVNLAFFTVNGVLSVAFFVVFFAAFAWSRWA